MIVRLRKTRSRVVISGRKRIHGKGEAWELTKGSFVFIKSGACLIEQIFGEPFCIVAFIMPDSFIEKFITLYKDQLPAPVDARTTSLLIPLVPNDILHNFCNSIMGFFTSKTAPPESLIELKFLELLLNLSCDENNEAFIAYLHQVANRKSPDLATVMESNFSYNLDLPVYAKLCNRSLSSFKRDFQQHFGTTPGKWLLEKRLHFAGKLLVNTNKSLQDVIFESGFENQAHFNRVFKTRYGMSPLQFRKGRNQLQLN